MSDSLSGLIANAQQRARLAEEQENEEKERQYRANVNEFLKGLYTGLGERIFTALGTLTPGPVDVDRPSVTFDHGGRAIELASTQPGYVNIRTLAGAGAHVEMIDTSQPDFADQFLIAIGKA